MKLTVNKNRKGFTLVEIMIVVAIIALLAAIAVPNFMRARKRSQATRVLDELRLIDAAIDQYALENNKVSTSAVSWADVRGYLKPGTALESSGGQLSSGTTAVVTFTTVGAGVQLPATVLTELSDVAPSAFWGSFVTTSGS